jgi:hypothetical protein
MNDPEDALKKLPRAMPRASLDARIERSLQNSAPVFARPVPLWACALATVIGIAAGAILSHQPIRGSGSRVVLVASAETQSQSFPFIGRSFVQP